MHREMVLVMHHPSHPSRPCDDASDIANEEQAASHRAYLVKVHVSREGLPWYLHLENVADRDDGIRHTPQPFDAGCVPSVVPRRAIRMILGTVESMAIHAVIYQRQPDRHVVIVVVLTDVVEDEIVLLQAEAQCQRQQKQDAGEHVRMLLHVSGEVLSH